MKWFMIKLWHVVCILMTMMKRCKRLTNHCFIWLHARTMMFRCSWWWMMTWWVDICVQRFMNSTSVKRSKRKCMNGLTGCLQNGFKSFHHKFQSWKWFGKWSNFDFMERSNIETIRTDTMEENNRSCFNGEFSGFNNGLNACCWRNNKKSIWNDTVFNECNWMNNILFHGVCNCTRWHNDWCANQFNHGGISCSGGISSRWIYTSKLITIYFYMIQSKTNNRIWNWIWDCFIQSKIFCSDVNKISTQRSSILFLIWKQQ